MAGAIDLMVVRVKIGNYMLSGYVNNAKHNNALIIAIMAS